MEVVTEWVRLFALDERWSLAILSHERECFAKKIHKMHIYIYKYIYLDIHMLIMIPAVMCFIFTSTVALFEKASSFLLLSKSLYLIFRSEKSPLWCSWKKNTAANNKPSQSITTNTNRAQSGSAQLTVLQCKIPPCISSPSEAAASWCLDQCCNK